MTRGNSSSPLGGLHVITGLCPSIEFAHTHLYTLVERGTVGVKCLAKIENTTYYSQPGLKSRPLSAELNAQSMWPTAPYNVHSIHKKLLVPLNYHKNCKVLTESGGVEHGLGEHLKALEKYHCPGVL